LQNSILLYRIYDVAEEIKLDLVERVLSSSKPTARLKLSRARTKSIHIPNPPVTVELGEEKISLSGQSYQTKFTAKIYDLGVISITMCIILPHYCNYKTVMNLAGIISTEPGIENIFASKREEIREALKSALIKSENIGFEEDYVIYYFRNWQKEWDPLPLLLGEQEEFSPQIRKETLKNSFSYSKDDLAIITWSSAIVYDAKGSQDIPDLLEFAATQLLELRYYDQVLSDEMSRMYDAIGIAETDTQFRRLGQYRRIMNRLTEIVIDINEITERIQDSLKVTEDIFYAKIYGAALSIFRTRTWLESIKQKSAVIMQSYSMLSGRLINQQSMLLELAIVLLFLLDIILSLFSFFL
jgi:hypothetical protein